MSSCFRTKQTQMQAILPLLLGISSTAKQIANCLQHVLVDPQSAALSSLGQHLYNELTCFNREVVQLHHLMSSLSNHTLHPMFWRQVHAELCSIQAALHSAVNIIYRNGEISVGTLRREKNMFVRALDTVKAVRRSLQTVYIVISNSVYSASVQYKSPFHSQKEQSLSPISHQFQPPVYIVHAGEDKLTMALPLWKKLRGIGIYSFLDREEMQVGDDKERVLIQAMNAAQVCVVITSPELAAKKWPMLEVDHFLKRSQSEGAHGPLILPVFYRLGIEDCYGYEYFECRDRDGRNLFIKWGFFERAMSGQTSVKRVVECLRELTGKVGLENDEKASNEDTEEMKKRREQLISRVVGAVVSLVYRRKDRKEFIA